MTNVEKLADVVNGIAEVDTMTRSAVLKAETLARRAMANVEAAKKMWDAWPEIKYDPSAKLAIDELEAAKELLISVKSVQAIVEAFNRLAADLQEVA